MREVRGRVWVVRGARGGAVHGPIEVIYLVYITLESVGFTTPFLVHKFELSVFEQLVGVRFRFLGITEGVGGCRMVGVVVVNAAFVITVVCIVECGLATFQHSHVTSLVRVGGVACKGDGCGGEGERDGGYVRECGVGVCAYRRVPVLVGPWRTVVVFEHVGFVPLFVGHPLELFELVRLVVTVCKLP